MKKLVVSLVIGFLTLFAGLALTKGWSWYRKTTAKETALSQKPRYSHQHLPENKYESGMALTAKEYKLTQGNTLAQIAKLRYGHQKYAEVIELYNHIEDEEKLEENLTLQLPDMIEILRGENVTKVAANEVGLILCARAKFVSVKRQLLELRRRDNQIQITVPDNIKRTLLEAATDLVDAIDGLKTHKLGVAKAPSGVINQLQQTADNLHALADGLIDDNSYSIDMVDQRLALALSYAIIWSRNNFE